MTDTVDLADDRRYVPARTERENLAYQIEDRVENASDRR